MNNCFFISEGALTFKVEGTEVITRGFFVSEGSEVIIVVSINKIRTIHKSIPPEYDKSDTGIRSDPEENLYTQNIYYV